MKPMKAYVVRCQSSVVGRQLSRRWAGWGCPTALSPVASAFLRVLGGGGKQDSSGVRPAFVAGSLFFPNSLVISSGLGSAGTGSNRSSRSSL